jgi:hypothetical protein
LFWAKITVFLPRWLPIYTGLFQQQSGGCAARSTKIHQPSFPRKSPESRYVADIEWKGARWESARTSLTIPDLLTILKGYGPMEVLRFRMPGRFRGEMSLCLTEDGSKEVTLYHLEVIGLLRQGQGRAALQWLKKIFRGAIYLEFPDLPDPALGFHPTMPFWFQMYREGFVDALDCENFYLSPQASAAEVEMVREGIMSAMERALVKL